MLVPLLFVLMPVLRVGRLWCVAVDCRLALLWATNVAVRFCADVGLHTIVVGLCVVI